MAVELQVLNSDNADLLAAVAPDVFDHDINPEYLKRFLHDPRHVLVVAMDSQTVVGMASAVEYFHPDKPPQLWINEVGVASAYRRRGIGRTLIEAMIKVAHDRDCIYAWLGTDVDNAAGQACFGSVPNVEEPQPFILYEWDLSDP